jgi:predicted enzyme related to lactoylglutathione lyase
MTQPNIAVWFELPTVDLDRARRFYETVLQLPMWAESFGDMQMVIFGKQGEGEQSGAVTGALVRHPHMKPSADGTVVYLGAGADLAGPLGRVEAAGGSIVLPKTSIAPHGFIALIIDSEGNKVGLHSMA